MNYTCLPSRRSFLRTSSQTLAAAALTATGADLIAGERDLVRALVCIYLYGGNDSNNMLVPLPQYDTYAATRGSLAIPRDALLRATSATDQVEYGFHPALAELHSLFVSRAAAVVAGVGHLKSPLPEGRSVRVPVPRALARHLDPDLEYLGPGYAVPAWAARFAGQRPEESHGLIANLPSLISTDGAASSLAIVDPGVTGAAALLPALSDMAKSPSGFNTRFPVSGIGQQLRQVAALLRNGTGLSRPIFVCSMGGFNTRGRQTERQAALFSELSAAVSAFFASTLEIGVAQRVTTYTDTEYNRTLLPNQRLGTDPAWAGHHVVIGGSVLGGQVHGEFPKLSLGGPDDSTGAGVWMPSLSKAQFSASLAAWYGMNYSELSRHLPEISNFARSAVQFLVG